MNGLARFFIGPGLSQVEDMGISLEAFRQAYPRLASSMVTNARQVAIWFVTVGLLAISIAWQGLRYRARWAWNVMWILVATPVAVGMNILVAGESGYGAMLMGLTAFGLVGQLLAYRGRAS